MADADFPKKRSTNGRKSVSSPLAPTQNGVVLSLVSGFAREYVRECRWRKLSPRTEEMRESITDKFLWWTENIAKLPSEHVVTRTDIESLLMYMQDAHKTKEGRWGDAMRGGEPLSDKAYSNYFAWLKSFWTWCVKRAFIESHEHPMLGMEPPRCANAKIAPLPLSDIPRLIQAAIRGSLNPVRDEALLLFLLDTGIRVSELCDLVIGDVDVTAGKATIRHGKGNKQRLVVFSPQTARTLRKFVKDMHGARPDPRHPFFLSSRDIEDGFVVPHPRGLTASGVRQVLERLKATAGIPGAQRVSPHMFRRTFATTMLSQNADTLTVQTLMGHESPVMTLRYATYNEDQIVEKHRQFSPVQALADESGHRGKRGR